MTESERTNALFRQYPVMRVGFHGEAAAEYDAAFDWYLERSPEAALKCDAEGSARLLPAHLFPQLGDVRRMMLAVPGIQRQIPLQRH